MGDFLRSRETILIAPYAAWVGMLQFCPPTAFWYAVRSGVTAALLVPFLLSHRFVPTLRALAFGLLTGLAVFVIWIAPETWMGVGAPVAAADSPYSPETCGWTLTILKLAGSAFVVSVAEEMFFRRWMVEFAGFWWTVALFAAVHGDRWGVGAITGVLYGLLARHLGLKSSVIAHATTNLVLGLWVIVRGLWQYW